MKVAMVTPYWFPVRGGLTTYVAELARELRSSHEVEVEVLARQGGADGATILGGTALQFARRAADALEGFRPDAVHAHGHWYALQAGLRYRRRHPSSRVVFTLHTPFPHRSFWRRYALKVLMSRADFVTAVSANLLGETFRELRPRVRARVTHPGVRIAPSPSGRAFLEAFDLDPSSPRVGYLGRLEWEDKVRGVERLIRAMKLVRAEIPGARLIVAGDGSRRRDLEALAAAEVPDGVVFLGDVPDPVPQFYYAVDVYAHISFQEGLPLALIEAMGCGVPVVATPVGGIPEAVQDGVNGFLVSGDPDQLAARILEILRTPALAKRLVAHALATVHDRFIWSRASRRFLSLYGGRTRKRVVVTIDLERDYMAPPGSFRGVTEALPRLLGLLGRHRIRTHVFATSDLAAGFPDRLQGLLQAGHEVGCHAESHDVEYLSSRPYDWQLGSIRRATEAIERCTGVRPRSFRAPNFSANGDTIRALEELGYARDSSVLPGRVVRAMRVVKRLDFFVAPRDPYRPSRENPALPGDASLWEVPVAENPFSPGGPIGLGYVNAVGAEKALEAVARSAADPCVIVIHPWELLDPPTGRVPAWMRTGCTSDAAKLDAFLAGLRRDHDVVTFDEIPGLTGSTTPAPTPG